MWRTILYRARCHNAIHKSLKREVSREAFGKSTYTKHKYIYEYIRQYNSYTYMYIVPVPVPTPLRFQRLSKSRPKGHPTVFKQSAQRSSNSCPTVVASCDSRPRVAPKCHQHVVHESFGRPSKVIQQSTQKVNQQYSKSRLKRSFKSCPRVVPKVILKFQ